MLKHPNRAFNQRLNKTIPNYRQHVPRERAYRQRELDRHIHISNLEAHLFMLAMYRFWGSYL